MDFKEWMVLGAVACCLGLWGCEESAEVAEDGGADASRDAGPDVAVDPPDMGPACPTGDVMVTEDVTEDTTWSCPRYRLIGQVFVTGNSTLTIAPGVQILGDAGIAITRLVVTRGARLHAVGTAAEPIVFTSGMAVGGRTTGDWGGVALLGSATLNAGINAAGILEGRLEGLDPTEGHDVYGGDEDTSSCGHLEYVRIEFSGKNFDTDAAGLTLAGCGSGTDVRHVQVHRSQRDGVQVFGGTAGMDHIVITGADDDSLDWDLGWRGDVQFLVIHQFPGIGDHGIEADNLGSNEVAMPRSNPRIWNATIIGATGTNGILLREGTRGTLRNMIVTGTTGSPIDLAATNNVLADEWPSQLSIENTFFFNNGAIADPSDNDGSFDESAALMDAARNNIFGTDPMLGSTSPTAPNYVPASTTLSGQATPPSGFDTAATYAGAFAPNGVNWAAGWTAFPTN